MKLEEIEKAQRRIIWAIVLKENSIVYKPFYTKLNWIFFLSCSFWMFPGKNLVSWYLTEQQNFQNKLLTRHAKRREDLRKGSC